MLILSEKYEQEGNKEKAKYWLDKAEWFEQQINKERGKNEKANS